MWPQRVQTVPRKVSLAGGDNQLAKFAQRLLHSGFAQVGWSGGWSAAAQASGESLPGRVQSAQNLDGAGFDVRLRATTDYGVAHALSAALPLRLR